MTCRHSPGDPNCSSSPEGARRAAAESIRHAEEQARKKIAEFEAITPDASKYDIEAVERVGPHLVAKVRYPNCARCSYEGVKVMVFLTVSEVDVIRWRKIDPHFRAPKKQEPREAPPPAARFPATDEGWSDALAYARSKT